MAAKRMPKEIEATLSVWMTLRWRWWVYHYALGIVALLCSITVASRPQLQSLVPEALVNVIAWVAALAVGLITFLAPSKKARSYAMAARVLSDARNRYESDPDYPVQKLLDAVRDGEEHVSRSDPI